MTPGDVQFARVPKREAEERGYLEEYRLLFNQHYGRWGPTHSRAGLRITMSMDRLKEYLPDEGSWVAMARLGTDLIGYAMVVQNKTSHGIVSWVTQFVVHADFRNQLIGSRLLASIWGNSKHYAWGIASANPFAIRALEKVTRRRCEPKTIVSTITSVLRIMKNIPYLASASLDLNPMKSVVDTKFNQDLSELKEMVDAASKKSMWIMGDIGEGEEWLAVTFNRQPTRRWSDAEFKTFMKASDEIALEAYERMSVTNQSHSWARPEYAAREAEYLIARFGLSAGSRVLDFGCGFGRHTVALSNLGIKVVGVDFSPTAVRAALNAAEELDNTPIITLGDCRTIKVEGVFDAAICLYDVIGSFPDWESNLRLLQNLASHVKSGGFIAISVMSYDYIAERARLKLSDDALQDAIMDLPASSTMQNTGEVFDGNYIIVDPREHVVYRRETFEMGSQLPAELIVRDRRFTVSDIEKLCGQAGLTIVSCGYVRAGNFGLSEKKGEATKEMLVIARQGLI